MRFYLAAMYSRHEELRMYADVLENHGHVVTSRWINGEDQALDSELLHQCNRERAQRLLQDDLEDLFAADTLIAFTEAPQEGSSRGGRHVEFGIALAHGLRLFVIGPRENLFYLVPGVRGYRSFDELWMDVCAPGAFLPQEKEVVSG